jgi:N-acylglucosamine 2-epimerase
MIHNDYAWHARELTQQVLPFWDGAFDDRCGGVFTCYSNAGDRLLSTDKYVWSQGRMLWCLSEMLVSQVVCGELSSARRTMYRSQADALYRFLHAHVLLDEDQGVCAFLTDREGTPKEPVAGKGLYTSFYVDCFVIMGYARYAVLTKDRSILDEAVAVFRRMQAFMELHGVRSEPYVLPPGHATQAVLMILCNTAWVLATSLESFGSSERAWFVDFARGQAKKILTDFYDPQRELLREIVSPEECRDTLLARHCNPGHAIECMWFTLDCLDDAQSVDRMASVVLASLQLGWDSQHGGLLRYVDRDGGQPQGVRGDSAFEDLVVRTWDYKLWWPHAEALYCTARMYRVTGNEVFVKWYQRLKEYVARVFPAGPGREWIQIRNRAGVPLEAVVALPVKDPYHIMRMHVLAMELFGNQHEMRLDDYAG